MDNRDEVHNFLATRRERLTPEQAGVVFFGGKRRVKGLRREEVAMLAGMSAGYYTRLERGNLTGVSDSTLEALARALRLDEADREHLFHLAGAAQRAPGIGGPRRSAEQTGVRVGVQRILDTIDAPAYVHNGRMDIVAANRLARALFVDGYGGRTTFNLARYLFLDPRARGFFLDWNVVANACITALYAEAIRNPYDRRFTDLIGQLCTGSGEFCTSWATDHPKLRRAATTRLYHAIAGDLELTGEALDLPEDPGLTVVIYTWNPSSPTEQALAFLSSWSTRRTSATATEQSDPM